MKILLLGSGGREHAFAWKMSQSPLLEKLWIAPGNAGTAQCGENVNLSILDFDAVYDFAVKNGVDLVVPGSEDPLVAGIRDHIIGLNETKGTNIRVAGPSAWAAQLEGSKDFSKAFMNRHGIPTAGSCTVVADNIDEGMAFLKTLKPPYVLKADGLAAGKGVIILDDLAEAENTLKDMILSRRFGAASDKVVIEEFLHGIEISVFAVSDGKTWKMMASAKDYKRIGEGDTGPNTGGMGAISPVPFAGEVFMDKVARRIAEPTFSGLIAEGHPFCGFLFMGLMNCQGEPMVIEYNVRMGDPETEAIFPRLKTDMVALLNAMADGTLDQIKVEIDPRPATTVFLVSGGYPGDIEKGKEMFIPEAPANTLLFHAGTKEENGRVLTNGGRVLAITAMGDNITDALNSALTTAEAVNFEGKYYRKDIGRDILSLNNP